MSEKFEKPIIRRIQNDLNTSTFESHSKPIKKPPVKKAEKPKDKK